MVVLSLKLGPQYWSTIVEPHHPDRETNLTKFLVWLWWVIRLMMKWIRRLSRMHKVLVSILDSSVVFSLCPFFGNRVFFLELSWSVVMSSDLVFCFYLAIGHLNEFYFAFKSSFCFGCQCTHQEGRLRRSSWNVPWFVVVMSDWLDDSRLFWVSSYFLCA